MRYALASPAVLLVAIALLAIAFDAASGAPSAQAADCRTFTATPTVSPTPTPTPPFTPFTTREICNDTSITANDLHVLLPGLAVNPQPLVVNAPGCSAPTYSYFGPFPPAYSGVHITWPAPCVEPGENVHISFTANCTTPQPMCIQPGLTCFYWTLAGTQVPSASPAINPQTCAAPFAVNATPGVGGAVDIVTSAATESTGPNALLWSASGAMAFTAAAVLAYRRAAKR